ncbi:MAG: hypothetical protein NC395_02270 [Prevotella sp.]|nr:hypothetical protein [Prevotella sp.]
MLALSSCGGNAGIRSKTPELNVPFETEVKIQAGELEISGDLKRYGTGIWAMRAEAPETLAGLEIVYGDEGVKASLGELSLDIPMENLNDGAVFARLFKAVDSAAAAEELSCADTADGKVFSGTFAGGEYSITFDPETLAPVRIDIPGAGICGEFENFRVITGEPAASETAVSETAAGQSETVQAAGEE